MYVNGEEVAADDVVIPTRNEGDDYAYTGEGVQTEIYVDDGDKTVTVVEINYYLAQVSSVNETEGTVSIRTISDLKADKAELDDRTFATTEFAKGDYVVFTIDQNADDDFYICEMTAPETVDGTVTRVNKNNTSDNSYLFLDRETRYDYSDHMAYDLNDETVVQHPSLEEDYTCSWIPTAMCWLTPATPPRASCMFRTPMRSCLTGRPAWSWPTVPTT